MAIFMQMEEHVFVSDRKEREGLTGEIEDVRMAERGNGERGREGDECLIIEKEERDVAKEGGRRQRDRKRLIRNAFSARDPVSSTACPPA